MVPELPVSLIGRLVALAAIVTLATLRHAPLAPRRSQVWLLCLMGVMDAVALGVVTASGRLPQAEYASVTASLFGVLTVLPRRLVPARTGEARAMAWHRRRLRRHRRTGALGLASSAPYSAASTLGGPARRIDWVRRRSSTGGDAEELGIMPDHRA